MIPNPIQHTQAPPRPPGAPTWEEIVLAFQRLQSEVDIQGHIPTWLWEDCLHDLGGNPYTWLRTPFSDPTCHTLPPVLD